jgi:hypothetical protein
MLQRLHVSLSTPCLLSRFRCQTITQQSMIRFCDGISDAGAVFFRAAAYMMSRSINFPPLQHWGRSAKYTLPTVCFLKYQRLQSTMDRPVLRPTPAFRLCTVIIVDNSPEGSLPMTSPTSLVSWHASGGHIISDRACTTLSMERDVGQLLFQNANTYNLVRSSFHVSYCFQLRIMSHNTIPRQPSISSRRGRSFSVR